MTYIINIYDNFTWSQGQKGIIMTSFTDAIVVVSKV